MNDQENGNDENLARLIRAGMGNAARLGPAVRDQMLRRLQAELRQGQTSTLHAEGRAKSNGRATRVFAPEPAKRRLWEEQKTRNTKDRRDTIVRKLLTRWGFGFSAAAGAAAVALVLLLAAPGAQGKAAQVMAKGARALAKLGSVHLRGQLRSTPQDNFSAIMPKEGFVTIELWKQFTPDPRWRIEKPGRVAVMDGRSTVLWIKPDFAVKGPPTASAFDTELFHQMADLSATLDREIAGIKAHGWPVTLTSERAADGKAKSVITVEAKSGLPDSDYLKNAFFMTADTRRVYVFDDATELLESVRIYTHSAAAEQLVLEVNQIEFNQPIDSSVFRLQLPANVRWQQEMQVLPDNAKYAAMTPEQAARTFLEACSRHDWTEAEKFCSPITESFKQDRGGIQVISIGKAFTSVYNGAQFVPYEIKHKTGQVVKHNLALKKDQRTGRWFVDGGI